MRTKRTRMWLGDDEQADEENSMNAEKNGKLHSTTSWNLYQLVIGRNKVHA